MNTDARGGRARTVGALACAAWAASLFAGGCAAPPTGAARARPSVAPATQPDALLDLGKPDVRPMYRELLPVDLDTVVRVATARNLDVEQARQRVEASRGRYESSVGAIFPVIVPSLAFQHLEGVNQNANGTLVSTNFNDFSPGLTIQWVLNPAKVAFDIVAARRRMEASEQQEESTLLQTARTAAVQYYDLVLAQAQLGVAGQAVAEAEELLRITGLRLRAGTGLPTDQLRAEANLAGLRQDVTLALNRFYQASVTLTLTLHLDSVVTLVPRPESVRQTTLVREDLPVEQLLQTAMANRPDLEAVRSLLLAASADVGDVVWGGLGPQVQTSYTYGGLQATIPGKRYGLHEQQKGGAGASFALGLSTFGQVKTARANERSAGLDVQRQADEIRAAVVSAQQTSAANAKLIPAARKQLDAAEQALRLAQTNLRAGTMLTIDVLQTQNEADRARLRYVDAVVHYNQAQVNLLAALGLLDPAALTAMSAPPPNPKTGPSDKTN